MARRKPLHLMRADRPITRTDFNDNQRRLEERINMLENRIKDLEAKSRITKPFQFVKEEEVEEREVDSFFDSLFLADLD